MRGCVNASNGAFKISDYANLGRTTPRERGASTLFFDPICHLEAFHFFEMPCIIRDQN